MTLAVLVTVLVVLAIWHLGQGTSGIELADIARYLRGETESVGDVSVGDVFRGSRLPRLLAGIAVGSALGVAGTLLQSISRNPLASPDTLAVTAGSYFAVGITAAVGVSIPIWASAGVAFSGGLLAAGLVLVLSGGAGAPTTRLILAGSAVAMALQSATSTLLLVFQTQTTGLYAWGSGSLSQLNVDAALRALPVIGGVAVAVILLGRRLDVLAMGDDAASTVGVPVRRTRALAVLAAVLLTSTAVTVAGPIAFVGLCAPIMVRLMASRLKGLQRHILLLPASGLMGAVIVVLADVVIRTALGAQSAASIPTGVTTALLGAVVMVALARTMRDPGPALPTQARVRRRGARRCILVLSVATALMLMAAMVGLLAGSVMLKVGDLVQWAQGSAPQLIDFVFRDRAPRVVASIAAGMALALAGSSVQTSVRNPLAEPGLLGITAGAGFGAALVTVAFPDSGHSTMVVVAVAAGLATYALITLLALRGGLAPGRMVLIGIGLGYGLTALTTLVLLQADPWNTPRIMTWLSGTTYGRSFGDVIPVLAALGIVAPLLLSAHRELDLLAVDDDLPRILGVRPTLARAGLLTAASTLAAVSVVAVGVIGFVGLVAPHCARALTGGRHIHALPVAMMLGGTLVCVGDSIGRTVIAPAQVPAGLVVAMIGAPYFVWLMWRSRV
ncbi:iron ABC transporter permease [Gordonia soli]|uniref:iron ABC transporter permease n=1 Tax=Gordonia soli TaxID=320799 RepID=UPI000348FD88|nr:iron ABC transporter permease [Gordonia soli]